MGMTDDPVVLRQEIERLRAAINKAYLLSNEMRVMKILRAAFEAMVGAWPEMYRADWNDKNELDPVIILPLTETSTKENDNG